ncbi:MAG: hypothetical protein ACLFPF_09775 [Halanaerobiales bacterium]
MKKIKSALEIAMERVEQIDQEFNPEEEELLKREQVKPLLTKFYKGKIDAEGLWQDLKDKGDKELYKQAQILLLDSIGLKTTEEQLKKRREGILAVENLNGGNNTSLLEQAVEQVRNLQRRYDQEHERFQEMYEKAMENAEMSLKPVRTQDGKTVMKLQQSLDEDTEKRIKQALTELEVQSREMLAKIIEDVKSSL